MFYNYLITALRNFTRHKLYSFINIAAPHGGAYLRDLHHTVRAR